MKVHLHIFVLLLYDTVFGDVCNSVEQRAPAHLSLGGGVLVSSSRQRHDKHRHGDAAVDEEQSCNYFIEAPIGHTVTLNFSQQRGKPDDDDEGIPADNEEGIPAAADNEEGIPAAGVVSADSPVVAADDGFCLPRLDVVELVPASGRERLIRSLCVVTNKDTHPGSRRWEGLTRDSQSVMDGEQEGLHQQQQHSQHAGDKDRDPGSQHGGDSALKDTDPGRRRGGLTPGGVTAAAPGSSVPVFTSTTRRVKLVYRWRGERSVAPPVVECSISFQRARAGCAFRCHDNSCLPFHSLVCNDSPDCAGGEDEEGCLHMATPPATQGHTPSQADTAAASADSAGSPAASSSSSSSADVLSIVLFVLLLLVLVAVFTVYWGCFRHRGRHGDEDDAGARQQLHRHPSGGATGSSASSNEVVYVPPPAPTDPAEREAQRLRERRLIMASNTKAEALNLPPRIKRSADGEEGWAQSRRSLDQMAASAKSARAAPLTTTTPAAKFVAPPNRTVFDSSGVPASTRPGRGGGGLSPPPYSAVVCSSAGTTVPCPTPPPPPSQHHNPANLHNERYGRGTDCPDERVAGSPPPYTQYCAVNVTTTQQQQQNVFSPPYSGVKTVSSIERQPPCYFGGSAARTVSLTSTGHSRSNSSASSSASARTPSASGATGGGLLSAPGANTTDFSALPPHLDCLFTSPSSSPTTQQLDVVVTAPCDSDAAPRGVHSDAGAGV